MFLWNLCVHLRAFALMTRGVKSVEITSLMTSNVSLHFLCVLDSPSRLTAVAKMKNFPVRGMLGLNLGLAKCNPSAHTTRATAFPAVYDAKTAHKLTDENFFEKWTEIL